MPENQKKQNLTYEERLGIIQLLIDNKKTNGKPKHGMMKVAADRYGVSDRTISSIWSNAMKEKQAGNFPILPVSQRSKRVYNDKIQFDSERFKSMPYQKKRNYRSIAHEMQVSKNTVQKWFKKGKLRAHTNQIKPGLTEINMLRRVKFSLQHLKVSSTDNVIKFEDMQHIIHIDEKWFNMSRANERYYLTPEEDEPYRFAQNKRFITKVMFLCAVSRPVYHNETGDCLFDGKIGIFPFTHLVPAQKNSKNRSRGTLELKPLPTVNKNVTKDFLVNQVIPAIKSKWPSFLSKNILIQQDNARPHLDDSNAEFRAAASSDGFNIHLMFQPPNSPDTNINDLGWFRALQSLQVEAASYNVEELVKAVEESFKDLAHTKLNCVFLSLQACMIEILKCKGSNKYKLPHIKKEVLMRGGMLPHVLEVDQEVVKEAIALLLANNEASGLENFIDMVGQLV